MYLLGIDVGTSGCKAAAFTPEGGMVALVQAEYAEYSPKPGWIELNVNEVWDKVKACTRSVVRTCSDRINAVALSVLGEAVLPVDRYGACLYPAITAYDAREQGYRALLQWWDEKLGPTRIYSITGVPLNSMPSVHKIQWIRDNLPEVYRRAWKFVCVEDFLIYKLTGETVISYPLAARTMMMDIRKKRWAHEILDLADLDEDKLSTPTQSGNVVGEVGSEAAEETGLATGTEVVAGGHDQSCAALGVGVTDEGPIMDSTGTVECIGVAVKEPVLTQQMLKAGHGWYCHTVKDRYLSLGFFPSAGIILRWYRDNFAEKEKELAAEEGRDVYDVLTDVASTSPPGAAKLLLLPHFVGSGTGKQPILNMNSRGAFVGLSVFHRKSDIIRAILEGITFELRQLIETFERCGVCISELRSIGGGAKSPFWLQLKADVTNKRIVAPNITEAATLGAALLAGIGAGAFKDCYEAVAKVYREKSVYQPNPANFTLYSKQYEVYKEVYPALVHVYEKLALL